MSAAPAPRIALALLLWRSKDAGYRKVGRLSLPTQVFQINEPIFFGLPIVLNPVFMVPYVLNALMLTDRQLPADGRGTSSGRPFVNVPWTTPPILGHYLVTGGDWRAAVWGAVSILHRDGGLLSVRQDRRTAAACRRRTRAARELNRSRDEAMT